MTKPMTLNVRGLGAVETASDFLKRRTGKARPQDMLPFLDRARREAPSQGDEISV